MATNNIGGWLAEAQEALNKAQTLLAVIVSEVSRDRLANYGDEDLIPDRLVKEIFSVTRQTLWRWENDPELGFPQPVRVKRQKARKVGELRAFRARMWREGLRRH